MTLYSRGQMIAVAAAVALAAAVVAGGTGALLATRFGGRQDAASAADARAQPAAARTAIPAGQGIQPGSIGQDVADGAPAAGLSEDERENIAVYEKYNESVVNITTEVVAVNWFLEPVPKEGGSGSGSVIDERGYILTNNHVVTGAYKMYVNFADGSRHEARLAGADPENDLAVIKFDPPPTLHLRPIPFGVSKSLKVGQKVLAIGNPFGLERTLTKGIVSGLGRPIQKDENTILQNMIQTDASINPGNSGGPLLNAKGEMIGVNTMIYSPSGGSVGIGFSIPVDTAVRIVPDLIRNGRVKRGSLDITTVQLFPDLVQYLKDNRYGAPVEKGLLVSELVRGGNAEKAGLKAGSQKVRYGNYIFNVGGDIITSVDGRDTSSLADLNSALEDNKPGDRVAVEFWRDGKRKETQVILAERKKE